MFYDNFKLMKYYFSLFLSILMVSCQFHENDQTSVVDEPLNKWANAYFNFDYKEALEYMTPESGKWVRFAASNITEKDINYIKEHPMETMIEITHKQMTEGDTLCNTTIHVSKFIQLGMDADNNQVVDDADFQIQLVKRDGDWLIKTEGLPRNGMQNRD